VRNERHQSAVAPGLANAEFGRRQLGAAFGFEAADRLLVPFARRHVARQLDQRRAVTLRVVDDATRRIQIDRFEWPHERPAQAKAVAHHLVDVIGSRVTVLEKTHRLAQQRRL
jgi:hypothetical protein